MGREGASNNIEEVKERERPSPKKKGKGDANY